MTLKIAICDDDANETLYIKNLLQKYEMARDVDLACSVFTSGDALLQAYDTPISFQLIFLDVEMPDKTGLDVAKQIRQFYGKQVKIIFVSQYPKYMQSSFDVQAFHYLTKPVDYIYLEQLMDRIINDIEENVLTKVVVNHDGVDYLINISDILYIESIKKKRDTLCIHYKYNQVIEYKGFLIEWEHELCTHGFVTPCRGYLVNLREIASIHKTELVLSDGQTLPLSKRQEKNIRELFAKQIITFS